MKCIDKTLIQSYIDGETNPQETEMIKNHISGCAKCATIIEEQRTFAQNIKKSIDKLVSEPIKIPDFITSAPKKRRYKINIRHLVYLTSAACAIIAVLFLFPKKSHETEYRLIYCYDGYFDSNKPYSQQEMVIKVIDHNGKIVTYDDF